MIATARTGPTRRRCGSSSPSRSPPRRRDRRRRRARARGAARFPRARWVPAERLARHAEVPRARPRPSRIDADPARDRRRSRRRRRSHRDALGPSGRSRRSIEPARALGRALDDASGLVSRARATARRGARTDASRRSDRPFVPHVTVAPQRPVRSDLPQAFAATPLERGAVHGRRRWSCSGATSGHRPPPLRAARASPAARLTFGGGRPRVLVFEHLFE